MTDVIKAISMWQPWASLWLTPNKRHETRHWKTPHRGKLLVHAAKKLVTDLDEDLLGILSATFGDQWQSRLRYGAIIGMVDLVDVIPTEKIVAGFRWTDEQRTDNACGNFDDGRFGWRRSTYWVFPRPIPYRGRQSMFSVPCEVVAEQIAAAKEVSGG
ncbi:ASCH domain-containing protein [Bradyrhizobium sp. AUGA SZCCT0158]|uniref:ASCH domain-containing protein n=1 Tax=Bradyrhizobium sp. AUGA SZCCT0158 TaxID=2807661 RepID=UPI001BA69678|nr:ASCH domain-containing protein [Bradyrhizobium sp. AUGA SZCCT0158]MBR1198849.1 ASCH domain-containing protein [Bradyrhizobium sp. AUGA SZCCT0158]